MKIFDLIRHAALAILVFSSIPLLAHYFMEKPQREWIVMVHVIIGLLFIVLSITGTILKKKAGKKNL